MPDVTHQLKEMFGGLLSAGWTLDEVLDLSWDQATFVAECVMLHKISLLNMVAEPVIEAMGTKYKRGRVNAGRRRTSQSRAATDSRATPESSDARLLWSIRQAGFGVESG